MFGGEKASKVFQGGNYGYIFQVILEEYYGFFPQWSVCTLSKGMLPFRVVGGHALNLDGYGRINVHNKV